MVHCKHMRNALFSGVLVLALAAGGYLYFSGYDFSWIGGMVMGAPQDDRMLSYSSGEGYSFKYPDTYELSARTEAVGGEVWHTTALMPRDHELPRGGEGPPGITVSSFSNAEGLPLEQFLRTESKANFALSDQRVKQATVGGKPALAYTYSGLYENDAVAVVANGKVYVFAAGWLQANDRTRADLRAILETVTFN